MSKQHILKAVKRNWLTQAEYAWAEKYGIDVSMYTFDGRKQCYVK